MSVLERFAVFRKSKITTHTDTDAVKSAVKCAMALQKHKLLKMTNATATDDGEQKKFDVILSAGIETVDDPIAQEAINKVIAEFRQENRVFPTGQPRYLNAKRKANLAGAAQKSESFEEMSGMRKTGSKIPMSIDSFCKEFHEFLFHFIHSKDIDASQPTYTLYDLFPPAGSLPDDGRPIDERYVFDEQPDSPYRYVPHLPKFRDAQRGWVLVKDIVNVMPLSLFVLVVNLKYEVPGLSDYLSDPIQRHTLIGDLPYSIRRLILTKKAYTQVEHHCHLLCVMGLACVAPNLDGNRSSIGAASLFFIARKGRLYDTSTSEKGYAGVTMPLELYNKYEYDFNDFQDIHRYWSHLKAIAFSTNLNCKGEGERESEEVFATSRKYTLGVIDRIPFQVPHDHVIDDAIVPPTTYRNGCAGFDPSFVRYLTAFLVFFALVPVVSAPPPILRYKLLLNDSEISPTITTSNSSNIGGGIPVEYAAWLIFLVALIQFCTTCCLPMCQQCIRLHEENNHHVEFGCCYHTWQVWAKGEKPPDLSLGSRRKLKLSKCETKDV